MLRSPTSEVRLPRADRHQRATLLFLFFKILFGLKIVVGALGVNTLGKVGRHARQVSVSFI